MQRRVVSWMVRAGLGGLLVALLGAGDARADVIYLRAPLPTNKVPPGLTPAVLSRRVPKDPRNPTGPQQALQEYAYRGRIVRIIAGNPSAVPPQPPVLRFQHEPKYQNNRWVWPTPAVSIPFVDMTRWDSEFDSLLDLRWLISNRDYIINDWQSLRGTPNEVVISDAVWEDYFRAAAGLPTKAPLAYKAIPPNASTEPFVEGWVVTQVQRGRLDPRMRDQQVAAGVAAGRFQVDPFDPLLREANATWAVSTLLEAAARDVRYRGLYKGMVRGRNVGIYYTICKRLVGLFCGLADLPDVPANRHARAFGIEARGALLSALESAHLGELSTRDLDPNDRTYADNARIDQLKRGMTNAGLPKHPSISDQRPVDPSVIAIVALRVIQDEPSWQTFRDSREARRVVRAVAFLAADPPRDSELRARDYARKKVLSDSNGPLRDEWLGAITLLKREAENSLSGMSGVLTGPDKQAWVDELSDLLVDGEPQVQRFVHLNLANVGFGEPATLEAVVNRLFVLAMSDRTRVRQNALGTLGRLAGLARSADDAEAAVGQLVARRMDELRLRERKGGLSNQERRLFNDIDGLAGTQRNDVRGRYLRRYAAELTREVRAASLGSELSEARKEGDVELAEELSERAKAYGRDQ